MNIAVSESGNENKLWEIWALEVILCFAVIWNNPQG